MKKYILTVMLVMLICIQCWTGSQARWYEYPKSVDCNLTRIGTSTATDNVAEFVRKNDLDKLDCVNCNKRGGLYVDMATLHCAVCGTHSLVSDYNGIKLCEFYEGQRVWDVFEGRGTVEIIRDDIGDSMSVKVKMDNGGYRWYYPDGKYAGKYEVRRLYPVETKSINFTLDKLFPEKKQERLSVRELVGSETAGLRCNKFVASAIKYNCMLCGNLLGIALGNGNYFCLECKNTLILRKENSMSIAQPCTKQSEIKNQLEKMRKTEIRLHEIVDQLKVRFGSVLSPATPKVDNQKIKEPHLSIVTDLAKIINGIEAGVNDAIENIEDIINCCEL